MSKIVDAFDKQAKEHKEKNKENPFDTPEDWIRKAYYDSIYDVLSIRTKPKEIKEEIEKEINNIENGVDVEKLKKWVYATQNKADIKKIETKCNNLLKKREEENNQKIREEKNKLEKHFEEKDKEIKNKEIEEKEKSGDIQGVVVFLIADKKRSKATETMTKDFLEHNSIYTTRDDEKSECWIYKEGIYIPQGITYIKEYCRNVLGKLYTTTLCNEVVNKIEADTFIEQEDFFKEEEPHLISVNNGILNLKTKELKPFNPSFKFFSKLDIDFIPDSKCPKIKEFFKSLFKDELEIKVIQEIFGFLLYREYFLEKAFMFLGSGRNGKGKTMELMKHFIGVDNCAEISLEAMEKDHFAIGELFKKYANLCGDLSKTALKHTGEFKKLTGRDLLSAARKFKTRVKFVNYSKMLFSCNELPLTYDITEAFFNRWIILDFPFTFLPQKEIEELGDDGKENIKIRDSNIIEAMTTKEEMRGLLCWALEGLKRLLEIKSFSYSPSTNETRNKWLRKSDSCMAFILDYVVYDYESYIPKKEFKNRYVQFCSRHKIPISGDKVIKRLLENQMGAYDGQRKNDDNIQEHVWNGIRFKFRNQEKEDEFENIKKQKKLKDDMYVVPEEELIQDVVVEND